MDADARRQGAENPKSRILDRRWPPMAVDEVSKSRVVSILGPSRPLSFPSVDALFDFFSATSVFYGAKGFWA
jgi:hypothetical protein